MILWPIQSEITYRINHQGSVRLAQLANLWVRDLFILCPVALPRGFRARDQNEESEPSHRRLMPLQTFVERDVALADTILADVSAQRDATVRRRNAFRSGRQNLSGLAGDKEIPFGERRHALASVFMCWIFVRPWLASGGAANVVHKEIFNVGDSRENY